MEMIDAGPLTTVQDMGRIGYAALGYPQNGACDTYSMKLANLFAGNGDSMETSAVLEFTMKGGAIRFTAAHVLALAGADMGPAVNGTSVSIYSPIAVNAGDVLTMGMARAGIRCYLAVRGGVCVPPVMGSRSTDIKCGLGGFKGRALKRGDVLNAGTDTEYMTLERFLTDMRGLDALAGESAPWFCTPSCCFRYRGMERSVVLRTVAGPQEEAFTRGGMDTFNGGVYQLTGQCDRMACRLKGPPVETRKGSDMISDGILAGSVQIASDGMPMVMMADHQTIGGYAKIGTVITADLPVLAQLRPGETVVFRFVPPEEGIRLCRKEQRKLQWLKERMCMR